MLKIGALLLLLAFNISACLFSIHMGETNATAGRILVVSNGSANACTFSDTAGVSELAGAFTMAADQTLTLIYLSSEWRELSRSAN